MSWLPQSRPRQLRYQIVGRPGYLTVIFYHGEIWLTQKQLAEIFSLSIPTISEHLGKIWCTGRYPEAEYSCKLKIKADDGKIYETAHYRLEILEEIEKHCRACQALFV